LKGKAPMKKRQKPILLVTLLAVFVVAAIGVNYYQDPNRQQQAQQQQAENEMMAQTRQDDHSNLGASAANQMKPTKKFSNMEAPPGIGRGSIMAPKPFKPPKPTPNDSSTTSQWYSDNSAASTGK
jgi:hypothetical protein